MDECFQHAYGRTGSVFKSLSTRYTRCFGVYKNARLLDQEWTCDKDIPASMETIRRIFGSLPTSAGLADFADDLVYPVHLHDANFVKLLMVCTLRFDSILDPQKLHSALTRLLEIGDWKKLGGRLRRNVSGCGCF